MKMIGATSSSSSASSSTSSASSGAGAQAAGGAAKAAKGAAKKRRGPGAARKARARGKAGGGLTAVAEEAIYQASKFALEKLLLALAREGAVSQERLEAWLAPRGVKSKRRKIAAEELVVAHPRGTEAGAFPIGPFSALPIPLILWIVRGLAFNERDDFTSIVSKGFRSPQIRRDGSLWSRFSVDLRRTGASVSGVARQLDTLAADARTVESLSILTAKPGLVARQVIKILSLPKFANITHLSLHGKRVTPAVLKTVAKLPFIGALESLSLSNMDSKVRSDELVDIIVKTQRSLRTLACPAHLFHARSVQSILNKSKLRDNKSAITGLRLGSWHSMRLPALRLLSTGFPGLQSLSTRFGASVWMDPRSDLPSLCALRHIELNVETSSYGLPVGCPPTAPHTSYCVRNANSTRENIEMLTRAVDSHLSRFMGRFLRSCQNLETAKLRFIPGRTRRKEEKAGKRYAPLEMSAGLVFDDAWFSGSGGPSSSGSSSSSSSSSNSNSSNSSSSISSSSSSSSGSSGSSSSSSSSSISSNSSNSNIQRYRLPLIRKNSFSDRPCPVRKMRFPKRGLALV